MVKPVLRSLLFLLLFQGVAIGVAGASGPNPAVQIVASASERTSSGLNVRLSEADIVELEVSQTVFHGGNPVGPSRTSALSIHPTTMGASALEATEGEESTPPKSAEIFVPQIISVGESTLDNSREDGLYSELIEVSALRASMDAPEVVAAFRYFEIRNGQLAMLSAEEYSERVERRTVVAGRSMRAGGEGPESSLEGQTAAIPHDEPAPPQPGVENSEKDED